VSDAADSTATATAGRGADVRVIPPGLFAGAFAVGALIDRLAPAPIPRRRATRAAGTALLAGGASLAASGAGTFRHRGTTVIPNRPVSTLITTGPYRFTRNPMYTGLTLCHAGGALVLGSLWPLATLPIAVLAVRRLVIDREERYLAERFGVDYENYRRTVPRWL
jgi:protein-S-isoprenylcysteine O-methyltransferase Ste14